MNNRLPPPCGRWIDRNRPVTFRFEGREYEGLAGDVLSSALWANGVRLLGRSFKYHRPRGIYSLADHDINVMVDDGRETNLRGDVLPISDGLDVRAVNTSGGLNGDRLRIIGRFARFLPVGFYYKAFHTPRRLFRFYENRMRCLAGLGRIHPEARRRDAPKEYDFCDLLVVGAGPAGLAAAIAAAEQGLDVLLVDEQPHPGGSLHWQHTSEPSPADDLLARAGQLDNLRMRSGTQAAGWYSDHWVALVDGRCLTRLRARALLVASGCLEQPAVFQNNDLPGVMLGSAAQRLVHLYGVRPFERAVVLAANSDGYRLALDLHQVGVELAAVVDPRPSGEPSALARQVESTGCRLLIGHSIDEAVPTRDANGVRAAEIRSLDADGRLTDGSGCRIECDGIAMSVGWMPDSGLVSQRGGRFRYDEQLEQLRPQMLPDGLFTAGRINGIFALKDQIADGTRAGLAAAAHLDRYTGPLPDQVLPEPLPRSHPYPIFDHPGGKNFVDLDEDLHLADFVHAHQEGYDNVELLKRYSTVGMGPSQGKLSNFNAVRILARLNGDSINQTGTTTSRPFHHPVKLRHLAGRSIPPQRHTPLHSWHVQAGAEMTHAGVWQRPEYYRRSGAARDELILAEASHVRRAVGVIDVGTLGKFHVRGPDAAGFLECIYTGRFADQKPGRLRYAVACDETGVIIEDGIVMRLADDHFYVTSTSSGASSFFRELARWKLILDKNVALIDATGQYAAINLAGPASRRVLEPLTDVDLSPAAFPYLGVRSGRVAGVPATLVRVGFVGELGYEIHCPASCGRHVWMQLMQSGAPFGIRPFGVEAQRLLRLEKGHVIVGQDTDALTTPDEANLQWAIKRDKPFFVGARSLEIIRNRPLTRVLCGLGFPADATRLPEECHLIVEAGEIMGRITSMSTQSTLGRPIAMAFLRPDRTKPGTRVQVRLSDRTLVPAEVQPLPFYDPDNRRQGEL